MTKEIGAGPGGTGSPEGAGVLTHGKHSDEDDEGGLNHLVSRNAGGCQWTWKKVTVVVGSGVAENVMPRSVFPKIPTEETERSKNGKGFEGPGGKHIKNHWQQVMSVRTLEGFVRKSTWQVSDVRMPLCQPPTLSKPGTTCSLGKTRRTSCTGGRRRNRGSGRRGERVRG